MTSEGPTTRFVPRTLRLDRPELVVLTGPNPGRVLALGHPGASLVIGSDPEADLWIADLAPRHAEISVLPERAGVQVRRLDGHVRLNGARVDEGIVGPGGSLQLHSVELRVTEGDAPIEILPSTETRFGTVQGRTLAMREVFGIAEAIASTTATTLVLGETGTGKDVLARSIHAASPRADAPWVTVDCGAVAPGLVESELFGHERGAFTGAEARRVGAFERAHGGTLFLDEIGELPLAVQPKLLGALDTHAIRRVGGDRTVDVDVRILAATKRNLHEEIRRGRFREDLFYRLAVVVITMPPLRDRREDIPLLVEVFRDAFRARTGHAAEVPAEEVQALLTHDWPGNVRELKNTVERALWLAMTGDGTARFLLPRAETMFAVAAPAPEELFDPARSFSEHKQGWEADFERRYLAWLLARSEGSLSRAARLASMDRKHLRGLARKHGLWKS